MKYPRAVIVFPEDRKLYESFKDKVGTKGVSSSLIGVIQRIVDGEIDLVEKEKTKQKVFRSYHPSWSGFEVEKERAHKLVTNHIKLGKIKKGTECEKCGATNRRIIAHHEDYFKPLEIVWLCDECHKKRHLTARL